MTFDAARAHVVAALREPLPGPSAHDHLAPRPRREWPPGFNLSDIRHAAGLLLFFPIDHLPHVLLTVRADTLGRHGGQVSLPGGVIDAGETVEHAALREAREEVGLDTGTVETLGTLTPLDIPVSGFRLHPVVACADTRPALRPSDHEVARILEIPVESLVDPARLGRRPLVRDGRSFMVPTFLVGGVEVWGATAMALSEFLVLLGWKGPSNG